MLKEKVAQGLNDQLNKEFFSSYLYLSMSAYLESAGYTGMANWMKIQSQEEYLHAAKIFDYILQAGGKVSLDSLDKPKSEWNGAMNVFEEALEHEVFITESVNNLAGLANSENDFATLNFVNWFVAEQVEEVATVSQIVDDFKKIGDNKSALFMLDRELGSRQPAPDSQNAQ